MGVAVVIIRKFVVRPVIICCRSVYKHPVLVGILLILLYLYTSFPFLFRLLVSASPVLVCTALLLGTLLSFGEHNIVISTVFEEEDEENKPEISEFKTGMMLESETVFVKDEFKSDQIVERSFEEEEEPLLDIEDSRVDVGISSENGYHMSREIEFGKQLVDEEVDVRPLDIDDSHVDVGISSENGYHMSREIEFGKQLVDEEVDVRLLPADNMHSESFEGLKSEEGSIEVQTGDCLEPCIDDVPESVVKADNMEKNHIAAEKSVDYRIRDGMESSSGSWTHFVALEDELSSAKKIHDDNFEDYISGEGSLDAQIGSPLELSLGSWNHLDSDHDVDNESDSGSDGAESSSPDASLADIIPMLDELDPLLEEDDNPDISNLSHHSNDESDQPDEDEEAGDLKSDGDDDDENEEEEEEARDCKEDPAKSAIQWTEEDQKNLMELGTSELERNQRLESLIARRRSKKIVTDLEGMDLSFPIAPISTARYNPFDNGQDSYGDMGLPPIPGSAPSIMVQRRNPFDLPYDSSEEKPDLTGDSFQEEFSEVSQRESANQRLFKRNETFSVGSSIFDFGRQAARPTRFRPYFVPERTDSDAMSYSSFERQYSELSESRMSYSSLQRQSSELSESRASSTALSPKVGEPSDYEEHGSQCSDDVGSVVDEGNDTKDVGDISPVIEVGKPTEMRDVGMVGEFLDVDYGLAERELGSHEVQFVAESVEINHGSSLSVPKECDDAKDEDVDVSDNYRLDTSMSDIPTDQSHEVPEFGFEPTADESHPKEPVYDSSPLAIKKNSSYSSISSDFPREMSEIDLYHVQRNLFAEDETKNHVEDTEDNNLQRQQDANDVTEVTDRTGSHFTELNPPTSNSLASPVAEYDFSSCKDSSTTGLLEEESLGDIILPNEVENIADGHLAGKLDASIAEMSFDDEYKSSVDLLVGQQEKQFFSFVDSNVSSLEVELEEETETKIGGSEQGLTSTSSMNNHENGASKELLFALDESHFLPHDSLSYDPQNQEFCQNKVGENADVLKVQEPDNKMSSNSLQHDESFSQPETPEKVSLSEMAAEENGEDKYSEEHDDTTQGDELAEDLLSELDAVNDFSVNSTSPIFNKRNFEAEDISDVHEEIFNADYSSSGMQFGGSTSAADIAVVQNSELDSTTRELNLAWSKESVLDSRMGDVNADEYVQADGIVVNEPDLLSSRTSISDLNMKDANVDVLTLEDQSVEENHSAFQNASKEDVEEPLDTGFVQDELIIEEVEAISPRSQTNIALSVFEPTLNDKESVSLSEEHTLDSSRTDPQSGISADIEKFEDLEIQINRSISVEALEMTAAESRNEFEESRPLHVDADIRDMHDLSLMGTTDIRDIQDSPVMETSDIGDMQDSPVMGTGTADIRDMQDSAVMGTADIRDIQDSPFMGTADSIDIQDSAVLGTVIASPVEQVDQIEGSGFMGFNLPVNSTTGEVGMSNSLNMENEMCNGGSIGSKSLEKDIDVIDTSTTAPAAEFVQQQEERHSFIEPDSECQLEPKGIRESETLLQKSLPEANILCDDESEDQSQRVSQLKKEQSITDRDCGRIQVSPVIDANGLSTTESVNSQIENVEVENQMKPEVCVSEPNVVDAGHVALSDRKDAGDASGSSTTEPEDHSNIINSKTETVDVQDQMGELKPEVGVSERDVSDEVHLLPAAENNLGDQDFEKNPAEKPRLQIDEERSREESHLEFSSSSSSSSSDGDSELHAI